MGVHRHIIVCMYSFIYLCSQVRVHVCPCMRARACVCVMKPDVQRPTESAASVHYFIFKAGELSGAAVIVFGHLCFILVVFLFLSDETLTRSVSPFRCAIESNAKYLGEIHLLQVPFRIGLIT